MSKEEYTIVFESGVDENLFFDSGNGQNIEVISRLSAIPGVASVKIDEEEKTFLLESAEVKGLEQAKMPVPFSFNYDGPWDSTQIQTDLVGGADLASSPVSNGNSYDYQPLGKALMSSVNITAASGPAGFFSYQGEDNLVTANWEQVPVGRYVDIVCIEAGAPADTSYNGRDGYYDFAEYDPQTFNITVTPNGSSSWFVTGSHRLGTLASVQNATLTFFPGDTINITNNASSSHPLELVDGSGNQLPFVDNQGAANGEVLTYKVSKWDNGSNIFYYRCTIHTGSMVGSVNLSIGSNSKIVKMDWSTYDSALTAAGNNQISNPSAGWLDDHGVGVMSAAAGRINSWAIGSDVRVIYIENYSTLAAYNAVLEWHKTKPVNPETGKRNATVTTGAWGYANYYYDKAVPIDNITTLTYYSDGGGATTVNRPGGGWGNDYSAFEAAHMAPKQFQDPFDNVRKWCIIVPDSTQNSGLKAVLTAFENVTSSGHTPIYHFRSIGNAGNVLAKENTAKWDNQFTANGRIINISISGSRVVGGTSSSVSNVTYYPLRVGDNGFEEEISIGAYQISQAKPYVDFYSTRGPIVDLFAPGNHWYGPYHWYGNANDLFNLQGNTNIGGELMGYFIGTSCAAPVAAGAGALFIEDYYSKTRNYPSIAQLRRMMQNYAAVRLEDINQIDWSNTPSATQTIISPAGELAWPGPTTTYPDPGSDFNPVHATYIGQNLSFSGAMIMQDLFGSKNLCTFLPKAILQSNGKFINSNGTGIRRPKPGTTGMMYPRRRLSIQK
jgi:hypothetical protein